MLTDLVRDWQAFMIHDLFQDYVVAQYCPMLDDDEQDFCVEWYGDAYIWMLVSFMCVEKTFLLSSFTL